MFPNVALNIFMSSVSVMMGLLRNQHQLARPTNKEALDWYKQNLKNGKVSEEATKSEAVVFFNLSEDKATISKAKFKKDIEGFIASHKSFQTRLLRQLLGEKGGSGKNYDIPPSNFRADISDEKERKREFLNAGREDPKLSKEYQDWTGLETCDLFSASVAKRETKMGEQIQITEGSTIKLIRERSCGRNIFDYLLQGGGERGVYSCHNE